MLYLLSCHATSVQAGLLVQLGINAINSNDLLSKFTVFFIFPIKIAPDWVWVDKQVYHSVNLSACQPNTAPLSCQMCRVCNSRSRGQEVTQKWTWKQKTAHKRSKNDALCTLWSMSYEPCTYGQRWNSIQII